jgi:signal peptidase I
VVLLSDHGTTIGLPGDRIHVVDTEVIINGQPLVEPYKRLRANQPREDFPPTKGSRAYEVDGIEGWFEPFRDGMEVVVPEGKYFAMGDNRDNSADSRYWGFVPRELIVGKALIVYWSYESDSDAYRQTAVRDVVRQSMDLVGNFFGKTRWSRTFRIIR